MLFSSDRRFRVWHFHVTCSQLLIRSQMEGQNSKNCDLVFTGVNFMQIPWLFHGIEISRFKTAEHPDFTSIKNVEARDDWMYRIVSEKQEFYIIASNFHVSENVLDRMVTSLIPPGEVVSGLTL